jgi:quercetin dioxygenase-like cupin family protein
MNDYTGRAIDLVTGVDYAPGAVVSKTLLDKKAGTLTLFAFDKGQGLSEHTAPFDATVQILDGTAELTVGGTPYVVKAGQLFIMPANIPHSVKAVERFKMMLIMIR